MAFPDWTVPFYIETDASGIAVGPVLSQDDVTGRRRILEFCSSKLNDAQRKYSAGELETYAVVAALRKWKVYLQAASRVVIITDHHPLEVAEVTKRPEEQVRKVDS